MTARWLAFGLWAAVAASAVYWGLKLFVPGTPVPPNTTVASTATSPRGDLTRLLGTDPVEAEEEEPVADSRFQLLGVIAPRGSETAHGALALIAVDGKRPKAYRVGAVVDGNTVLKSVRARGASLGPRDGNASVTLDIPPPAPAATGTLPPINAALPPPTPVVRQPGGVAGLQRPGTMAARPLSPPGSRLPPILPQGQQQAQQAQQQYLQQQQMQQLQLQQLAQPPQGQPGNPVETE